MTQNGKAPSYGYNRDGEVDVYEYVILQRVTELRFDSGLNHQKIAEILTQEGKVNRSGNEISEDNVSYWLKNVIPRTEDGGMEAKGRSPAYGQMWSGYNKIVENPYETKILRETIKLREKGISHQKIADNLAGRGYRNRMGQPINKANVSHWLRFCIPDIMMEENVLQLN